MIRTHNFNGIQYSILLAGQDDGFCDAPTKTVPSLAIMCNIGTKKGFETAIHEALHATNFDKSEACVTRTAKDISNFLWRLGFRKVK